jgi:type I site-specific restriction-modification system R (restriction) subunit
MKAMMPNAVFIGFIGTPLLKKGKATSLEVFGGYIHTYKFSEALPDEVGLTISTRRVILINTSAPKTRSMLGSKPRPKG